MLEQLRPCGAWVANMHPFNNNNFLKNTTFVAQLSSLLRVAICEEVGQITLMGTKGQYLFDFELANEIFQIFIET